MKLNLGDVISGLEYAGDTGVVTKIIQTIDEVIYELDTSRADGFKSQLQIGYNQKNELMVAYGGLFGDTYWEKVNWKIKKTGTQKLTYPKHYTIFINEEPERD